MAGRKINLAIISHNKDKYSETFIHSHINHLPANIHLLYNGYLPYLHGEGLSLFKEASPISRFFYSVFSNKRKMLIEGIKSYLRNNKIEIVLAEYGPSGVEMSSICRDLNIPLIVHFHGYDAYREDILRTYGNQYPGMFQNAAAILGVSGHMCQQLEDLGAPEGKIHYVPYGVDINIFYPSVRTVEDPIFISCGRFVSKKAPLLTIKAFNLVHQRISHAQLLMIGEGKLLEQSKRLVIDLGLTEHILFKGILKPIDVAAELRNGLVFVQHSIVTSDKDSEGTPLSVLEAGACGLPVVATRHGGIMDIITEGETGFLVEEGDVEAMAAKMIELARMPHLAHQMGSKASVVVREKYNMELYIENLWNVVKQVI